LFIFSSFALKRRNEKRSAIVKAQRLADLAPAHAKKKRNQKRRKYGLSWFFGVSQRFKIYFLSKTVGIFYTP